MSLLRHNTISGSGVSVYLINCGVHKISQIEHTCVDYIQIKNLNAKVMFYFYFYVVFLLLGW